MSHNYLFGDAKATAREGDARRKQKAYDEAQANFNAEQNAKTQTALATALFDLGRFQEAERLLRDVLNMYGENLQVLCDLAFVCKNLNKLDEARRIFTRMVEIDPKHALARCAENELWTMDPTYRPSWMRK